MFSANVSKPAEKSNKNKSQREWQFSFHSKSLKTTALGMYK